MGPINPDDEIGGKIIEKQVRDAYEEQQKSKAALVIIVLLLVVVIIAAGGFVIVKYRNQRTEEIGYYEDPEE